MSQLAHPPSAEELEELREIVHRDPGSSAFVDLGEAYLALGRPRDAAEIGLRGLAAAPGNLEGRVMVARAYVSLHQWKQAQAELLKVVKTDRSHAPGFTLLGEVLMRRADYERALPVLQHAQNLDPANPRVLSLLKRARTGQPLDPPPPIPTPRSPSSAGARPPLPRAGGRAAAAAMFEDDPTRVAGERGDATEQVAARFGTDADGGFDSDTGQITGQMGGDLASGLGGPIQSRLPLQSEVGSSPPVPRAAPPIPPGAPGAGAKVRPRVLPAEKPKDAAQASLRQSAAVGENYLNSLLMSGLLDVPNVRAPKDDGWELSAGRRWARRLLRAMIVMFVLLGLGLGGGGYWYWYTEQQRQADVAGHLAKADELVVSTRFDDLEAAREQVRKALERDRGNVLAFAKFAQVGGLQALLYGTAADDAERAMSSAAQHLQPGEPGERELLVARIALVLARLPEIEQPVDRLAEIRKQVDAWLETHPDDHLLRWLQGEAILAGGSRSGAMSAFRAAEADGKGPAVATIARANMLLDEGEHAEALKLYDAALERAADHPLALIGRSLVRAELGEESAATMDDLNVRLSKDQGPRVAAYKKLALAYARFADEYYEDFAKSLDEAAALNLPEPRYRARVALGRALQGQFEAATEVRSSIKWYGSDKPEPHPLAQIVDAELLLAAGLPGAAFERAGTGKGLWARLVRGRALFEQGQYGEALAELETALEGAPKDIEEMGAQQLLLTAWADAARYVSGDKARRSKADEALASVARRAKNKTARVVHGIALLRRGDFADATDKLNLALDDITADRPSPLLYRAHTELARIALAEDRVDDAAKHIQKALEQNRSYLAANALMGRVALKRGNPDLAAEPLQRAMAEPAAADAGTELAFAEAMVTKKKTSKEERDAAREALRRAKEKKAPADELARVAALVDPALVEELDLPADKKRRR